MFKFVRFAAALVASATSALLQVPSQANIGNSSYIHATKSEHAQAASARWPWMNDVLSGAAGPIAALTVAKR
jgi:hypothetical protein